MRRRVPLSVQCQILRVSRAQTRRISFSPLSFHQDPFQEFVRPLNKEQRREITKKQLYHEPTLRKHVEDDLRVMLELNQATPELVKKKRGFIEELEKRLQARFGPAVGVMSIGLDAYGPPLMQAPFELALYDKGRPLGFPDREKIPQDAPAFYDPQKVLEALDEVPLLAALDVYAGEHSVRLGPIVPEERPFRLPPSTISVTHPAFTLQMPSPLHAPRMDFMREYTDQDPVFYSLLGILFLILDTANVASFGTYALALHALACEIDAGEMPDLRLRDTSKEALEKSPLKSDLIKRSQEAVSRRQVRVHSVTKDSPSDCSPRWVDTTIHRLGYSRRSGNKGKDVRQALFRFLKWHRTRPWKSEYFDWYQCKHIPRMSVNPRSRTYPKTVDQLMLLTKLRAFDRPLELRTWDEAKTSFVIQDPFDHRVNHTWSLDSTFMQWFNKTLSLFSDSLGSKQSLEDSLKCIQHPQKRIPNLRLPAFKAGTKGSRKRMPTPLNLEGNLWRNIREDANHIKPPSES